MDLITYFNDSEIRNLYNYLVEYSIRNYESQEKLFSDDFKAKYNHALSAREGKVYLTDEQLKSYLTTEYYKYLKNQKENKNTMQLYGNLIETYFIHNANSEWSDIEKANYLFDFCSEILTYSEDYLDYCTLTPPKKGIEFDFCKNIPVDGSIDSLLTMGQGTGDDFCNLMQHLGSKLGLNISKIMVTYMNPEYGIPERHCLNTIMINGVKSLIDITSLIRHDMDKEGCFLVSENTLDRYNLYRFDQDINAIDMDKGEKKAPTYDMYKLTAHVKVMRPKVKYEKIEWKEKQKSI